MTTFGVHVGLQETTAAEVLGLYRRIDNLGYGWISVWDHFYSADLVGTSSLEGVAMHAALAAATKHVTVGSLVYSISYRHPAVLAKAIATIDQISGGRAAVGMGAGWHEPEYHAYGIEFPAVKVRMEQLEEGLQVVRSMLHNETTDFAGTYYQLTDARCDPRPIQPKVPIWVGGGGEKRTLLIAARYADAWNVPFVDPTAFAHKREVLAAHCESIGRDPESVKCTVNVGVAFSEESLGVQFGKMAQRVRPGVLMGSQDEMNDRIGQYEAAGATQINLAMRAPFDPEIIDRFASVVGLQAPA